MNIKGTKEWAIYRMSEITVFGFEQSSWVPYFLLKKKQSSWVKIQKFG